LEEHFIFVFLIKKIFIHCFLLILSFPVSAQFSIKEQLQKIKGVSFELIESKNFKECYVVYVDQPLDHFGSDKQIFRQRIYIGFNNVLAPTVMETEGYATGTIVQPEFIKECNVINIEHRYYGKSLPDSLIWQYLTIRQAAYDCHHIKELFGSIFKGKWMTTGISKGGQTAVAYKMYFPDDADATIAYVTPVKKSINDNRLNEHLVKLSQTECGKKVYAFQKAAFINKAELLKEFNKQMADKKFHFGALSNEVIFEYMLLEYPFAFFQNCFDCKLIPAPEESSEKTIKEIISVVPPRFYSDAFKKKLEPSFYMFYNELGYYEYDIEPFKKWLSKENYPNNIFAPANSNIQFHGEYLKSLNSFIEKNPGKIIFIYGEFDPYTALQPVLSDNSSSLKLIVKNGCHKSRINDLSPAQQKEIFTRLSKWLNWPAGY
jgi:PS-10 peptidase S37